MYLLHTVSILHVGHPGRSPLLACAYARTYVCVCCFLRAQTLVDVFHAPLVRWLEQQQDTDRAGTVCCPVSRTDVAFVFSNLDELVVFSRYV